MVLGIWSVTYTTISAPEVYFASIETNYSDHKLCENVSIGMTILPGHTCLTYKDATVFAPKNAEFNKYGH